MMFDVTQLIVGAANAADTAASLPPPTDMQSTLMRFAPWFLIMGVIYFIIIRPQQKQAEAHASLIKALKKGDEVITSGGIVGVVVALEGDNYVKVEIDDGVQVKVVRSTITTLVQDKSADTADKAVSKKKS